MTDAIEKAREAALQEAASWNEFAPATMRTVANAALDAFLASLKASGLVIVPVEPTEGMKAAPTSDIDFYVGYLGPEIMGQIYAAMIAAEGK